MIVDCHTHIYYRTDDSDTSEHLDACETVDACIVLASPHGQSDEINKKLAHYVNKHKKKMVGFAVVHPGEDKASSANLNAMMDKGGFKGIVLYCADWGIHPTHSRAMRLYEAAQELNLPVFFHNSNACSVKNSKVILSYTQPYLLDEVAREFPSLKIIIGSMGSPFVEQTLAMTAKHENVFADLTIKPGSIWQTYNTVIASYENGVMDKLLFGSGFPSSSAGECIETLLGFNMRLADTNLPTVPRGNLQSIIERNTLEILGITGVSIEVKEEKNKNNKGRKAEKQNNKPDITTPEPAPEPESPEEL